MSTPCKNSSCKESTNHEERTECAHCKNIGQPGTPLRIACDEIADLYRSWGTRTFVVADILRNMIATLIKD
jgi:hypothetical protein